MSDLPEFDRSKALTYLLVGAVVVVVGIAVLRGQDDGTEVVSGSDGGPIAPKVVSRPLTVDVSGAVARPGVYKVPRGSRVIDAIERAGGATGNGLPGAINRAALLADGQQVVVPVRGTGRSPVPGAATDAPVSLGTATQADLERIDGIGPVTAQRILEFRDSQGGVSSVDDLDRISGVGPVTMESLRSALQP
ncbi:MAG: helix-hairpin-helix domain-containing protein [Solirubrobacterales bacterium]